MSSFVINKLLMLEYKNRNRKEADIAINKFSEYIWYLSETLIGLSFFDNKVSIDEKPSMVISLIIKRDEDLRSSVI